MRFSRFVLLAACVCAALAVPTEPVNAQPEEPRQWTRAEMERLFPPPLAAWSVSEMKVDELETLTSGMEGMFGALSAVGGAEAPRPSVRYRLSRDYGAEGRTIEMVIDTEDIDGASLVLTLHGYSHIEDGEPVASSDDDAKKARNALLENGFQPVEHEKHLALTGGQGEVRLWALLLGEAAGVVSLACGYPDCGSDLEAMVGRLDVPRLEEFARFDHREAAEPEP